MTSQNALNIVIASILATFLLSFTLDLINTISKAWNAAKPQAKPVLPTEETPAAPTEPQTETKFASLDWIKDNPQPEYRLETIDIIELARAITPIPTQPDPWYLPGEGAKPTVATAKELVTVSAKSKTKSKSKPTTTTSKRSPGRPRRTA